MLDWVECEISGHLKAEGKKGQYWILDGVWKSLYRVNPTPAGPKEEHICECNDIEAAKSEASIVDGAIEE